MILATSLEQKRPNPNVFIFKNWDPASTQTKPKRKQSIVQEWKAPKRMKLKPVIEPITSPFFLPQSYFTETDILTLLRPPLHTDPLPTQHHPSSNRITELPMQIPPTSELNTHLANQTNPLSTTHTMLPLPRLSPERPTTLTSLWFNPLVHKLTELLYWQIHPSPKSWCNLLLRRGAHSGGNKWRDCINPTALVQRLRRQAKTCLQIVHVNPQLELPRVRLPHSWN